MLGDSGRFELPADALLPYLQHIAPGVVALDDGSLMAVAEMPGLPFELEPGSVRNPRSHRLDTLARLIGDDNVTMHVNFVHADAPPDLIRGGRFLTNFARATYEKYERLTFGSTIKANTWLLSIVVHPRVYFEGAVKKALRRLRPAFGVNPETERQLEDIMQVVMVALSRYGVRRLGYRQADGWTYSEIGEALALIMAARPRRVPMANGPLGGLVYTDPVVFNGWWGRHSYSIETIERPLVGMILSYKEYPSRTIVGMLNELLGLDFPVVVTHSFRFINRNTSQTKMTLRAIQMENAGDKAITLLAGLIDMQDQVASNRTVTGSHHFSLAVYSDDPKQLASRASKAATLMAAGGAVVARETRGAMAAYFTQLPGGRSKFRCRPGTISSRNFAHFASLDSYPLGEREGYWGAPVIQFKTNGGTLYNWHPHVGEVGHTFVSGRTGSGKTLFLAFLSCALQRALGPTGSMVLFDKDQGMMVTVKANGGSYTLLRRGTPSGCAPLRVYDNTPRNVDHLTALYKRLILLDRRGEMKEIEEDGLYRGVSRQLQLPKPLRSMLGILPFLGSEESGAAARFAKWCRGGVNGWLFDNDADEITADAGLSAFDFTELLPTKDRPDDGCAGAMASDIMFRLRDLMDGRRFAVIVDECRFYMDSIAGILEDFALTGRKKEMMLVLAAQRPGHVLNQPLGRSILAQCPTAFLFPEERARWVEYGRDGLGCTPAEFLYLKDKMTVTRERQVIIKREGASVAVQFDIGGMDDEITILSGRPDTAKLMRAIIDELGEGAAPDALVAEFKRRWRLIPRIAQKAKPVEEELV